MSEIVSGSALALRGGCWYSCLQFAQSAYRGIAFPRGRPYHFGLRLVRRAS